MRLPTRDAVLVGLLAVTAASSGCSVRRIAINQLADALSEAGGAYAADDDPDLIREALPFSLKLVETLLETTPRHRGLLTAAASGFTQYTYAFVQQQADEIEDRDLKQASSLRERARRLYVRAFGYGRRGLEVRHDGFTEALRLDPTSAAASITSVEDVPLLYWTAASLGLAISVSKDDPDMVAELPTAEALIRCALDLDEGYDAGAIHEFLISFEGSRTDAMGGSLDRARKHYQRAVELSKGGRAQPFVTLAEVVSVRNQDRAEFVSLLQKALQIDVNANPGWRLANIVMQRRARWLLERAHLLFVE